MNTQALAIQPERKQLTANDVRAQVNLIQEVMKAVMKKETHYGVIPGCKKPSLYKAGSEVLLTTFRIAVDPQIEDLSTDDEIRYRVRTVGTHQSSGVVVGVGVGECSSGEDKYKWRSAVCDEEWEGTPEDRRRIKYSKYQGKVQKRKQVRTDPSDVANTVLKMAKKRAQIDLTLTATAASDIFTQDWEDLPEEYREVAEDAAPTIEQPQSKIIRKPDAPPNTAPIGDGPKRLIQAALKAQEISEAELCKQFSVKTVDDLTMDKVNDILKWIKNPN